MFLPCVYDHARDVYEEWDMLSIAEVGYIRYRQVSNAMRRLAPTHWVERVRVGRYRLTPSTVEAVRPILKHGTRATHFRSRSRK